MNLLKNLGILLASSAMICLPLGASFATGGEGNDVMAYVPAHGHCPALTWHFSRIENADGSMQVNGPIWFVDGTGASFATGTADASGNLSLRVTRISGNGPNGTITGRRAPSGDINATAAGSACFAGNYHLTQGQNTAKTQ